MDQKISELQRKVALKKRGVMYTSVRNIAYAAACIGFCNTIFFDASLTERALVPIALGVGMIAAGLSISKRDLEHAKKQLDVLCEEQRAIVAGDYTYHAIKHDKLMPQMAR